MKQHNIIKIIKNYLKNHKIKTTMYIASAALLQINGIALTIFGAKVIGAITTGNYYEIINTAILLFIFKITYDILSMVKYSKLHIFLEGKIVTGLRKDITNKMLEIQTKKYDTLSTGTFLSRIKDDPELFLDALSDVFQNILSVLANLTIYLYIFIINIYLGLFFVIMSFVLYLLENKRANYYSDYSKTNLEYGEKNQSLINEFIKGIRDIKGLNIKNVFRKKINDGVDNQFKDCSKLQAKSTSMIFIRGGVGSIFFILMMIFGVYLISNKSITIAEFLVIYVYQDQIHEIIADFGELLSKWKKAGVSANRIMEIFDESFYEIEKFGNKGLGKIKGNIEFKNVSFSYGKKVIFNNLSFKIPNNKTIAFVGKSGQGKTTIFNILNKMYDITDGEVLIDNINIDDLTEDSLRNHISVVNQNPYIFNLTIRENLLIANPDATDDEMLKFSKLSRLHDFVKKLENGYDTVVGEGGITLSGGERQRLAIARALLKQSKIIMFDESTSALDNKTQKDIQDAIKNISGEYTILIIAHRLSTIVNSDIIMMIDAGKITNQGTHEELIKISDEYRKLYDAET